MTQRLVRVTETITTVYEVLVALSPDEKDQHAENMAVDLLTNYADDPEFMDSVTVEERLIDRKIEVERA